MPLIIDRAQSPPAPDEASLRAWASTHTVFISSRDARSQSASAEQSPTCSGRSVDVVTSRISAVATTTPRRHLSTGSPQRHLPRGYRYRYGRMLPTGRSPTHQEYLEARRRGLRIATWVAEDDSASARARPRLRRRATGLSHDRDILDRSEPHSVSSRTGSERSPPRRTRPWVKLDDIVFRASSIEDDGSGHSQRANSRPNGKECDPGATSRMRTPAARSRPRDLRRNVGDRPGTSVSNRSARRRSKS